MPHILWPQAKGQAAGSRFRFHLAFVKGGSGILPLAVIQPELRRMFPHSTAPAG